MTNESLLNELCILPVTNLTIEVVCKLFYGFSNPKVKADIQTKELSLNFSRKSDISGEFRRIVSLD